MAGVFVSNPGLSAPDAKLSTLFVSGHYAPQVAGWFGGGICTVGGVDRAVGSGIVCAVGGVDRIFGAGKHVAHVGHGGNGWDGGRSPVAFAASAGGKGCCTDQTYHRKCCDSSHKISSFVCDHTDIVSQLPNISTGKFVIFFFEKILFLPLLFCGRFSIIAWKYKWKRGILYYEEVNA